MRTTTVRGAILFMMTVMRLVCGSILTVMWSVAITAIARHRRIERSVEKNDAIPRPTAKANFLLLLAVVFIGLSALLIYVMK